MEQLIRKRDDFQKITKRARTQRFHGGRDLFTNETAAILSEDAAYVKHIVDQRHPVELAASFYANEYICFLSEHHKNSFLIDEELRFLAHESLKESVRKLRVMLVAAGLFSCLAESRHAFGRHGGFELFDFVKMIRKHGGYTMGRLNREEAVWVYYNMFKTDIRSFEEFFEFIFSRKNVLWDKHYGGIAWLKGSRAVISLIKAKTLKEKITAIDHAIDMQHNSGILFNKYSSFDDADIEFRAFLNWKFYATSLDHFTASFRAYGKNRKLVKICKTTGFYPQKFMISIENITVRRHMIYDNTKKTKI